MPYYLREFIGLNLRVERQVWKIDEEAAFVIGMPNPLNGIGTYFCAQPGEAIWDAIKRQTSWFEPSGNNPFQRIALGPGEFYPRMARPIALQSSELTTFSPGADADVNSIAISRGQLTTLIRQLDDICRTIHPASETLSTFGHEIRNLIILACTEVESHWRGILHANGVHKKNYNTNDYIKLKHAMKLDEYSITFSGYPWLEFFRPFANWNADGPTASLGWYDAYNAIKHNRETQFSRSTLRSAFEAVSACYIMMVAQFDRSHALAYTSELQYFLNISEWPIWDVFDYYIGPDGTISNNWTETPFPF
ncbi:MAG: hypothetical protein P4M15_07190 [Alphaproteobacteria bacterium]|nr:hypothetical protein [Alphaproteobacteria bacterium]